MLVLAIDTSTPDLIVGLVRKESTILSVLAQRIYEDSRQHNELLTPTVVELLAESGHEFSDIEAIVVGCGPGPFTGLRVGMVTAAAMGHALDVPVYGVSTHDAIATQLTGSVLAATDARRKEVYWTAYCDGVRVAGPDVISPKELSILSGTTVISVPKKLEESLPEAAAGIKTVDLRPLPECLVAVADFGVEPGPLEPLYLRRPDAKEPAVKPKSPAIPDVEL